MLRYAATAGCRALWRVACNHTSAKKTSLLSDLISNCQCLEQQLSRWSGSRAAQRQQSHSRALRGYVKTVTRDHAVKQTRLEHAGRVVLLGQAEQGVELGVEWGDGAPRVQEGPVIFFSPVGAALEPVEATQQPEQSRLLLGRRTRAVLASCGVCHS